MTFQDNLYNTINAKQFFKDEPDSSSSERKTIEVNDSLAFKIYYEIFKILHDPPLYAWFDSNYRTLEQSFVIQVINGIVYVNEVHNRWLPVSRYKIKDFLIQEDGKWKPDWEAIKNIKIYY